jgi:hypothetical protein
VNVGRDSAYQIALWIMRHLGLGHGLVNLESHLRDR